MLHLRNGTNQYHRRPPASPVAPLEGPLHTRGPALVAGALAAACQPAVARLDPAPAGARPAALSCAVDWPAPYARAAYVSNHGGPANRDRVPCTGPATFAPQWHALPGHLIGQPNTFSPDGHTTYVSSTGGPDGCALHALATQTGETRWARCDLGHALVASAVDVDADGRLYFTDGATVHAADPDTGDDLWQTVLDDRDQGLVYGVKLAAAGLVLTQVSDGTVYALDRQTGAVRGRLDVAAETGFVPPAVQPLPTDMLPPYVWDRIAALFGTPDRDAVLAALGGLLGASGAFADNTLAVSGSRVYTVGGGPTPDQGAVVALDLGPTGALSLAWTAALAAGSASSVAVGPGGDRAWLADGAGTILVLDLDACDANTDADPDPGGCAPAWTHPQPGIVAGSLTLGDAGVGYALTIGEHRRAALTALDDQGTAGALRFARSYGPDEFFTTALTLSDDAIYGVLTDMPPLVYPGGAALPLTLGPTTSRAVVLDPETGAVRFSTPVPSSSVTELIPDPHGGVVLTMAGLAEVLVLDPEAPAPVGGILRLAP